MRSIGEFLSKLTHVKTSGKNHWQADCPCPNHSTPQNHLSVTVESDKILVKCFGNHSSEDIVEALGLTLKDLFISEKPNEVPEKIVATYDYHDEKKNLLFQVVRYEPKNFRQRHKNGSGEWVWNLHGVRRVLYHLPELVTCTDEAVYLVEGEKDADNLWEAGIVATTSPQGAGSWNDEYADYLKGLKVVVIPDKDVLGYAYAKQAIKSLEGKARETKVIILPGEAKDVSDWLKAGNDPLLLASMEQDVSALNLDAPRITTTITGYIFKWPDLTITVRRVDIHKAGNITGEITVETKAGKLLPSTQFNFSASRTRKELANDLATRDKEHDWPTIVQTLCDEVQTRARAGDEGQVIEANDDIAMRPRYILEPLVMEGVPSILYGDKGSKKTSLCLAIIGCIATAWQDNPFGFAVDNQPHSVAFLDWESNWDLTRYNILRLRKGMGFPYFKFAYRNCGRFALADDLEAIQTFLDRNKTDVIVIDSLSAACGGDIYKPEPAIQFFSALRQLPATTSLIIGQNAKNEEQKKSILGSTIFTYYSRNVFEIRRSESTSETEMSLGVFHKEGNYSKRYKPIGLHVIDSDQSMIFEPEELNAGEFSDRIKKMQILQEFLSKGVKPVSEIARQMGLSENATRVILTRAKKKGTVVNISTGIWGLAQQPMP